MAKQTIRLHSSEPSLARPVPKSRRGKETLQWLGDDGKPLAAPIALAPAPPMYVEVPGDGGAMAWFAITPPRRVSISVPKAAMGLKHKAPGAAAQVFSIAQAAQAPAAPRAPDAIKRWGTGGRWKLALVSERFDDQDSFFAHCADFDRMLRKTPPFDAAAISTSIEVLGLFWSSIPASGLFDLDFTYFASRVLTGDNDRVGKFVAKAGLKPSKVIVLINYTARGGAGGDAKRPSWVTITSAPGELWEMVAMHELGHAFGLADEYEVDGSTPDEPKELEPNVSRISDPQQVAWSKICTMDQCVPSTPGIPLVVAPPGAIGAFEGARYKKTGRYRPTFTCKMRSTMDDFCPVCRAEITRALSKT